MYKNAAYGNKWFYAFITDMTYLNDERTDIQIETDVIQTWLKDYVVKPSFVEREHVYDDSIGIHTVPEGLETGEYTVNTCIHNTQLKPACVILATTVDLTSLGESKLRGAGGGIYNNITSGTKYYYFNNVRGEEQNDSGLNSLTTILRILETYAASDAVIAIFMAPANLISRASVTQAEVTASGFYFGKVSWFNVTESTSAFHNTWEGSGENPIKKPKLLDGYTPTNNKLLTYPFTYLNLSNNAGGNAIYKYELFNRGLEDDDVCDFEIYSAVTPGGSVRAVPKNYNSISENNDEGLNGGKYPICGWATDVYTNWLTQNSLNHTISYISGAVQIAGGIAAAVGTGGVGSAFGVGAIASGVSQIAGTVAQVEQQSLVPPQAEGNLNSGDVTFSSGYLTFSAYQMSIKAEYAKIIDNYFNMFGYKLNLVKDIYSGHRENYWYTKTIDVTITGAIPQDDLQKIKDCYNNGITFWRNPENVGDYSVSNQIVKVYG